MLLEADSHLRISLQVVPADVSPLSAHCLHTNRQGTENLPITSELPEGTEFHGPSGGLASSPVGGLCKATPKIEVKLTKKQKVSRASSSSGCKQEPNISLLFMQTFLQFFVLNAILSCCLPILLIKLLLSQFQ